MTQNTTYSSIAESGASYLLTLRCDRPIESCEVSPVPYLHLKGGTMDNLTRNRLLDSVPYYYSITWSRGPKKQICAHKRCPRGNNYEPVHWSKVALGGPELVCSVCEKAGKPGYDVTFCSGDCFKQSWAVHSQCHAKLTSQSSESPVADDESPVEGNSSTAASPQLPVDKSEVSEWPIIHKEKTYTPVFEDVGCRLRIQVVALSVADNSVLAGPVEVFSEPVLSAPIAPHKKRLSAISGAAVGIQPSSVRFRVVSYNILAEIYATKQVYPHCDNWNLSWPYRRKLILDELEECQGDVVCLQEVQADYYDLHLSPLMSDLGYDGSFKPKSRDGAGNFGKVDGCAMFWKKTKFTMSETYTIEFNDIARQEASDTGMEDTEARKFMNRLSKDNVAQIILLEALVPRSGATSRATRNANSICVVNTHLHANPLRPDVKLWQAMNLMREVTQFITQRDLALLLCGDFNSEPNSAVYEYMMTGNVDPNHSDLFKGHNTVRILPDASQIAHSLDISSAMLTGLGSEPLFTNYTTNFKGTLDYVFYSTNRLRVMAITNLPEEHELRSNRGDGLPNASYPSDHLMMCCDMAMIVSGNGSILNGNSMMRGPSASMKGRGGSSNGGGGYGNRSSMK